MGFLHGLKLTRLTVESSRHVNEKQRDIQTRWANRKDERKCTNFASDFHLGHLYVDALTDLLVGMNVSAFAGSLLFSIRCRRILACACFPSGLHFSTLTELNLCFWFCVDSINGKTSAEAEVPFVVKLERANERTKTHSARPEEKESDAVNVKSFASDPKSFGIKVFKSYQSVRQCWAYCLSNYY